MSDEQDSPTPDVSTEATPTLGGDDLMPWEKGSPGRRDDTLEALEDLIAQEDPDLADDPEDDDDESPAPVKTKKPAPSDEEDADDDEEVVADADDEKEEEDDDEEEVDDSDEELEEFDLPMDAIVEVPVAGKKERVTLGEAIEGYQRQADYTRKTQALAGERTTYRTEVEATLQVREALGQQLALLEQALAEDGTPPDHWAELRTTNPEQFANEYAAYEARNLKLKQVRAFMTQQQTDATEELQKAHNARLIGERNKLTEAIPKWADETVFDEALEQIQTFIVDSYGATEKELEAIYDHRFILMARDAMLYRRARSKGKDTLKKAQKKGVRILKPGATKPTAKSLKGKSKRRVKAFTRARGRLAKSGNVRDAAAALLALEDD